MARRKPTMVRLDGDLVEGVKLASERFGQSRSAIICAAIDAFNKLSKAKQKDVLRGYLVRSLREASGGVGEK